MLHHAGPRCLDPVGAPRLRVRDTSAGTGNNPGPRHPFGAAGDSRDDDDPAWCRVCRRHSRTLRSAPRRSSRHQSLHLPADSNPRRCGSPVPCVSMTGMRASQDSSNARATDAIVQAPNHSSKPLLWIMRTTATMPMMNSNTARVVAIEPGRSRAGGTSSRFRSSSRCRRSLRRNMS